MQILTEKKPSADQTPRQREKTQQQKNHITRPHWTVHPFRGLILAPHGAQPSPHATIPATSRRAAFTARNDTRDLTARSLHRTQLNRIATEASTPHSAVAPIRIAAKASAPAIEGSPQSFAPPLCGIELACTLRATSTARPQADHLASTVLPASCLLVLPSYALCAYIFEAI